MSLIKGLFYFFQGVVRVHLRCGQTAVAQQILNRIYFRPLVQKMRRVRVP